MTRRDEDVAETMFTCSSHDYIMFFTDRGRAYRVKGFEIPESSRTGKGMNIVNILPITNEEKVTAMICVPSEHLDAEDKFLCMVTRKGIIKRTELEAYKNIRKNGVIAINLDDDDELAWVHMTNGNDDLLVATKNGMGIRFNEEDARAIGRTARGVKAITLRDGDEVVGMVVLDESKTVITVTETGYGRRSKIDDYRQQSRGGIGTINYHTEKYGKVASVSGVSEDEDIILISSDGIIIRIPADSISIFNRPSKGVRVMKATPGEKIVTMAITEKSKEDDSVSEEAVENSESDDNKPIEN